MPATKTQLEQLENVIEDNLRAVQRADPAFLEIGRALAEINRLRLYKTEGGFSSFDDYCRERWDFGRSYAYRLIQIAEVVETVSTIVDGPLNQAQASVLVGLPPEVQREVVAEAQAEGNLAASNLSAILDDKLGIQEEAEADEEEEDQEEEEVEDLEPDDQAEAFEEGDRRELESGRKDGLRDCYGAMYGATEKYRRLAHKAHNLGGSVERVFALLDKLDAELRRLAPSLPPRGKNAA